MKCLHFLWYEIKYLWVQLLVKWNPEIGKRLVVLCSLLPLIDNKKAEDYDLDALERINKALDLCINHKAMYEPIKYFSGVLGNDLETIIKSSPNETKKDSSIMADIVFNNMPKWLRYSKSQLTKDIEILTLKN